MRSARRPQNGMSFGGVAVGEDRDHVRPVEQEARDQEERRDAEVAEPLRPLPRVGVQGLEVVRGRHVVHDHRERGDRAQPVEAREAVVRDRRERLERRLDRRRLGDGGAGHGVPATSSGPAANPAKRAPSALGESITSPARCAVRSSGMR